MANNWLIIILSILYKMNTYICIIFIIIILVIIIYIKLVTILNFKNLNSILFNIFTLKDNTMIKEKIV